MSRIVRTTVAAIVLLCIVAGAQARDRSRIVQEGGIGDEWTLVPGTFTAPGYPADAKASGDNVCMAIGYAISPQGKTGDYVVLREWTDAAGDVPANYYASYNAAATQALSQWRFAPREGVTPRRTITSATLTFRGKQAIGVPALGSECKIGDLAAVLQEANFKNTRNDRMQRDMENTARQGAANQSMISNPAGALGRSR